jgi:hypothetical protein
MASHTHAYNTGEVRGFVQLEVTIARGPDVH